jgi:hypothetical protein
LESTPQPYQCAQSLLNKQVRRPGTHCQSRKGRKVGRVA